MPQGLKTRPMLVQNQWQVGMEGSRRKGREKPHPSPGWEEPRFPPTSDGSLSMWSLFTKHSRLLWEWHCLLNTHTRYQEPPKALSLALLSMDQGAGPGKTLEPFSGLLENMYPQSQPLLVPNETFQDTPRTEIFSKNMMEHASMDCPSWLQTQSNLEAIPVLGHSEQHGLT